MDEIVKKAFELAEYAETFSAQKQILKEEYTQNLNFYFNGGVFLINKELINFVKTIKDITQSNVLVLTDINDTPIEIPNLDEFLEKILSKYHYAINEYYTRFQNLKTSRTVESILQK